MVAKTTNEKCIEALALVKAEGISMADAAERIGVSTASLYTYNSKNSVVKTTRHVRRPMKIIAAPLIRESNDFVFVVPFNRVRAFMELMQ